MKLFQLISQKVELRDAASVKVRARRRLYQVGFGGLVGGLIGSIAYPDIRLAMLPALLLTCSFMVLNGYVVDNWRVAHPSQSMGIPWRWTLASITVTTLLIVLAEIWLTPGK